MPRAERSGVCRPGRKSGDGRRADFRDGGRRSQEREREQGKIVERSGAGVVHGRGLGMCERAGCGLRQAAAHFVAGTAASSVAVGRRGLRRANRRPGREQGCHQEHQAAKKSQDRFHKNTMRSRGHSRQTFVGFDRLNFGRAGISVSTIRPHSPRRRERLAARSGRPCPARLG